MSAKANDKFDALRAKIRTFPSGPGVYFMKGAKDKVLYIGKAKNLRSRVGSYFQPASELSISRGPKIAEMVGKVETVDFIESNKRVEAT